MRVVYESDLLDTYEGAASEEIRRKLRAARAESRDHERAVLRYIWLSHTTWWFRWLPRELKAWAVRCSLRMWPQDQHFVKG